MSEPPKVQMSDPLFEVDSSEDLESEVDFVFGKGITNTAPTPTQRKYKLSKVVQNRIDRYIDRKLYGSMYYNQQT